MIIIDNNYEIGGTVYRRTASDTGLLIRKVGTEEEVYGEAVDVLSAAWTYEETDEPVPAAEPEGDDGADAIAAMGILGYTEGA